MTCAPNHPNLGGRPKEHDMDEIAIELLKWVKKPESVNLCGFSGEQLISPRTIMRWAKDNEGFCRIYETVKAILGERRERMVQEGTLHNKAYDLNINTYDLYRRDEVRDQIKYEAEVKAKLEDEVDEAINDSVDKLLSQLSSMQSARKIERSNINAEPKS